MSRRGETAAAEREDARLLYVACTRARRSPRRRAARARSHGWPRAGAVQPYAGAVHEAEAPRKSRSGWASRQHHPHHRCRGRTGRQSVPACVSGGSTGGCVGDGHQPSAGSVPEGFEDPCRTRQGARDLSSPGLGQGTLRRSRRPSRPWNPSTSTSDGQGLEDVWREGSADEGVADQADLVVALASSDSVACRP